MLPQFYICSSHVFFEIFCISFMLCLQKNYLFGTADGFSHINDLYWVLRLFRAPNSLKYLWIDRLKLGKHRCSNIVSMLGSHSNTRIGPCGSSVLSNISSGYILFSGSLCGLRYNCTVITQSSYCIAWIYITGVLLGSCVCTF